MHIDDARGKENRDDWFDALVFPMLESNPFAFTPCLSITPRAKILNDYYFLWMDRLLFHVVDPTIATTLHRSNTFE